MQDREHTVRAWHEESYSRDGFGAQRRYPNEELCRFMGREYFCVPREARKNVRILEVGCGSGANLWMLAREGFDAYGIDLSAEAVRLCGLMLENYGVSATTHAADMKATPFSDAYFDAIVDVFSAYCLNEKDFGAYLDEVRRLLKPGGRYFSYTPSKGSDAFRNHAPSVKLDSSTLDGIQRRDSPYFGNFYPFRFTTCDEYAAALAERGLATAYRETVARTYRQGKEYFEFTVVVAVKEG